MGQILKGVYYSVSGMPVAELFAVLCAPEPAQPTEDPAERAGHHPRVSPGGRPQPARGARPGHLATSQLPALDTHSAHLATR